MIPIFYAPPENFREEIIELPSDEGHHLRRVMRLGKSDAVIVIDGTGTAFKGEVDHFDGDKVFCRWFSQLRNYGEPHFHLTLAAGLSTGYKFDEVVQRGTEIGVSRFIPVITARSKVNLDEEEAAQKKIVRWRKVALAAAKQCERSLIPTIENVIDFEQVFDRGKSPGRTFIFAPTEDAMTLDRVDFAEEGKRFNNFTLITGPESGFGREELELAKERRATVLSLGKRILRTENAAPIAAAVVMYLLGEFK